MNSWNTWKNDCYPEISKHFDKSFGWKTVPQIKAEINGQKSWWDLWNWFKLQTNQKIICHLYGWAPFQCIEVFGLLCNHALFSLFPSLMLALSPKLSKSALHNGVGKHYCHFQTRLVENLILTTEQHRFRLFLSEEDSGEIKGETEIRQLNESPDQKGDERHPIVNLSKVLINKMKIFSWCLPSRIKPHHVTATRQNLGIHTSSIPKESNKGSTNFSGAATKRRKVQCRWWTIILRRWEDLPPHNFHDARRYRLKIAFLEMQCFLLQNGSSLDPVWIWLFKEWCKFIWS